MSQQVQTEKSGKDQLFEMLRQQKLVAEDKDKLMAEWLNEASAVLTMLKTWLGPIIDEGLFTVKEQKIRFQPVLYLATPNDRVVAIGPSCIGGGYDEDAGRITISSGPNRANLILKKTGEWKIRLSDGSRKEAEDLTEETFIQVISSMIQ